MSQFLRAILVVAMLATVAPAWGGHMLLDPTEANGIGDGGGSPFLFEFESPAPMFEFALLEFADYESLGLAITDDTGFALMPVIHSPGSSMMGTFAGTTGNYMARVTGVGNGAFGLQVVGIPEVGIPEPGSWLLMTGALVGIAVCRNRFDSLVARQAAEKPRG